MKTFCKNVPTFWSLYFKSSVQYASLSNDCPSKKKNEKKVNFMIKILICTIKDLNTCMNMINDLIKKKFEKFFRRTNKILQITLFIPQV